MFQNWAQYRLTMKYLSEMTDEQTLVLYSGHPLGLFPSHADAPRLVVTCGMVIPSRSQPDDYERLAALGVTSYGQMTAGSFMYIGPQGIVHGTTITLLNAGRQYLGATGAAGLAGRVFVTLGPRRDERRAGQGGGDRRRGRRDRRGQPARAAASATSRAGSTRSRPISTAVLARIERGAARQARPLSLGYLGNVVDLWERLAAAGVAVDLGSDQTSLAQPVRRRLLPGGALDRRGERAHARAIPTASASACSESLRRQVEAINALAARGMRFWDYGNAFLLEAARAGAAVTRPDGGFRYPSYVEDIMGPLCFDLGFGPFRWVCTSGDPADLRATDRIAAEVLDAHEPRPRRRRRASSSSTTCAGSARPTRTGSSSARRRASSTPTRPGAGEHRAGVQRARSRDGRISAPIVLGRDHHDVSGTDSPYRETANIRDGSSVLRRHGRAQRHRRRVPRRDVGQPAQRRRRGLGRGDQRRLRPGARRQRGCGPADPRR